MRGMVSMVDPFVLFQIVVGLFLSGSVIALVSARWPVGANWLSHGFAAIGCLAIIRLAWDSIERGNMVHLFVGEWLHAGSMTFRIDTLAAFFLLILGVVGTVVSIYAIGYTSGYYGPRYAALPGLFNFFLLSIFLVITAGHIGLFLIAWEMMTMASLFLILFEHENAANVRVGFVYVVMTHIGTAFVIGAFFILAASAGSLSFQLLGGNTLTDGTRNIVFLFALLGFGTKAGIIPLHVWLPKAHSAAPSHVSALLSGVMLKTAIYGLCRFYLEFLGVGPAWWGLILMGFGILSAIMGVLYAIVENDIKRLLAYSSIENMGVILLGMGAGMVYASNGKSLLAGLAWAAALYHVFNHAIFQSLLFMGAGAVVRATGVREMEALGGLIQKMPYTALAFLSGSVAISSLPPFNGFVSEWLTLQTLFFLPEAIPGVAGKVYGGLLFAGLGMAAALVAACFVKAFGIVFLARPRSRKAETATEAPVTVILPMAVLSLGCLSLGLWPQFLLRILSKVLTPFAGIDSQGLFRQEWSGLVFRADPAIGFLSVQFLLFLLAGGGLVAMVLYYFKGIPRRKIQETWACGIIPTTRNQYSATGFSKPIRWAFRLVLRSQPERTFEGTPALSGGRKLAYNQSVRYIFDGVFYRPVQRWILRRVQYIKRLQVGSVQLYVGYILIVIVVVLAWNSWN